MEFYNEIVEASKNIEFNLESICRQLYPEQPGAERVRLRFRGVQGNFQFADPQHRASGDDDVPRCDNGIRHGRRADGASGRENVMRGLMEILRNNLREGDVITHFSPRRRLRCCCRRWITTRATA